jgi:hypothetical protein
MESERERGSACKVGAVRETRMECAVALQLTRAAVRFNLGRARALTDTRSESGLRKWSLALQEIRGKPASRTDSEAG